MDLQFIDIAFRGAGTGICLILCISIWLSRVTREAQLALTLLTFSSVVNLWSTVGPTIGISDANIAWMRVFSSGNAFAMTWFAITIFLDDRRYAWVGLASGLIIWVCVYFIPNFPAFIPALRGFAAFHFLGLLGLVWYSSIGDLQDARRRLRPAMSAFLLIYCVGQALTQTPNKDVRTVDLPIEQSVAFWFFLTVFTLWALKANLQNWPGETAPRPSTEPTIAQQTSEQNILVKRINQAMEEGVWRVEGLTVGGLAQQVKAPEHQVRKAINQVLGHRNFASFINGARIDAAIARLADEDAMDTTVLEIAYDVGFSSLGPFNRAFRDATGQSPTDYRKVALAQL